MNCSIENLEHFEILKMQFEIFSGQRRKLRNFGKISRKYAQI